MILFSKLVAGLFAGVASLLGLILARDVAVKSAAYAAYISITSAFLVATFICINSLWAMASAFFSGSGGWDSVGGAAAMGLGMIVPSNAATVLACCASVWTGSRIYMLQKQGIFFFGR